MAVFAKVKERTFPNSNARRIQRYPTKTPTILETNYQNKYGNEFRGVCETRKYHYDQTRDYALNHPPVDVDVADGPLSYLTISFNHS